MTVFTPLVLYAYKECPQSLGRFGGLGVVARFLGKGPPLGPGGFSGICGVFGASTASCVFGVWAWCRFLRVKKRNFKLFLIVRGCFWVRVPPLAGSRFWQFFGFLVIFALLEFQNGQIELPKGPGQDLPENAPFAFVPHKEFINKNSIFVLLDFGFNDSMYRFETSGK